jgi:hypothetical protein
VCVDAGAFEGLGCSVFFTQGHQPRHFIFGQFDFHAAPLGQPLEFFFGAIFDFVRQRGDFGHPTLQITAGYDY